MSNPGSSKNSGRSSSPQRPHLCRAVAGAGFLVLLIALAVVVENWRGKRAWNRFRTEWEAKGERFDLAALVPNRVADDHN